MISPWQLHTHSHFAVSQDSFSRISSRLISLGHVRPSCIQWPGEYIPVPSNRSCVRQSINPINQSIDQTKHQYHTWDDESGKSKVSILPTYQGSNSTWEPGPRCIRPREPTAPQGLQSTSWSTPTRRPKACTTVGTIWGPGETCSMTRTHDKKTREDANEHSENEVR